MRTIASMSSGSVPSSSAKLSAESATRCVSPFGPSERTTTHRKRAGSLPPYATSRTPGCSSHWPSHKASRTSDARGKETPRELEAPATPKTSASRARVRATYKRRALSCASPSLSSFWAARYFTVSGKASDRSAFSSNASGSISSLEESSRGRRINSCD